MHYLSEECMVRGAICEEIIICPHGYAGIGGDYGRMGAGCMQR